ncbi:hypothetical protein B7463_g3219, partial [Scytalidium lignicola]
MTNLLPETRTIHEHPGVSHWLFAGVQPDNKNQTSQLALSALAATYYGKLNFNQQAVDKGAMLYTRVLSKLQKDLDDPERVLETETLTNALFLAVQMRGPYQHQTGVGKHLLLTTRSSIALAHLVSNKRCFLEEYAWKVVPWAKDPESKSSVDYLIDILCDMPGIMEDLRLLQDTPVGSRNLSEIWISFGQRIKSSMECLYRWRVKWEEDFSNTYHPVGLDRLRALKAGQLETYPFETAIFFTEPGRASELSLYNSMLVLFHRAVAKLPPVVLNTVVPIAFLPDTYYGGPYSAVLLLPGQGSVEEIVFEICRTVYYQLLSYPGTSGAFYLMFPLQVAYRNVDPKSRVAKWLSELISYVANIHGFEAVTYARNSTDSAIIV